MGVHTAQNSSMKVTQQTTFRGTWAPLCLADFTMACNATFLIFIALFALGLITSRCFLPSFWGET